MSALGQKRTLGLSHGMSALPPKSGHSRTDVHKQKDRLAAVSPIQIRGGLMRCRLHPIRPCGSAPRDGPCHCTTGDEDIFGAAALNICF
jgi:hypothetical protein